MLLPRPTVVLPGIVTDGHGAWLLATRWPAGFPAGAQLFLQAWIPDAAGPDGYAASNGLELRTP